MYAHEYCIHHDKVTHKVQNEAQPADADLTPLANVSKVGSHFLSLCMGIKSIDLTPLSAVEVLPDGFLSGCIRLEEVDLSPLTRLADVGDGFLKNCASLKAIILAPHQPIRLLPSNKRELVVRARAGGSHRKGRM